MVQYSLQLTEVANLEVDESFKATSLLNKRVAAVSGNLFRGSALTEQLLHRTLSSQHAFRRLI